MDIFYIINFDIAKMLDKLHNELNEDPSYFEKYKYLLILEMDEQELLNLEVEDDMINTIKNKVIDLNKDAEFYHVLSDEVDDLYLKRVLYNKGEEVGRTAGIEQNKIESARRMKLEKLPFDLIGRVTGLDYKTIESL